MAGREGNAIVKKQLAQREAMWPGMEPHLWDRKANKGFTTIPKTMPIILQIMDEMSKGKPLASTYLGLWCSTWDNSMVNALKHGELAHSAGFSGQRAEYTWGGRIQLLHDLHFIDVKPGRAGPISHILIWNPHYVIRWHYVNKTPGLMDGTYNALLDRAVELGANDLLENAPLWVTTPAFDPQPVLTAPAPPVGVAVVPPPPVPPATPSVS